MEPVAPRAEVPGLTIAHFVKWLSDRRTAKLPHPRGAIVTRDEWDALVDAVWEASRGGFPIVGSDDGAIKGTLLGVEMYVEVGPDYAMPFVKPTLYADDLPCPPST